MPYNIGQVDEAIAAGLERFNQLPNYPNYYKEEQSEILDCIYTLLCHRMGFVDMIVNSYIAIENNAGEYGVYAKNAEGKVIYSCIFEEYNEAIDYMGYLLSIQRKYSHQLCMDYSDGELPKLVK